MKIRSHTVSVWRGRRAIWHIYWCGIVFWPIRGYSAIRRNGAPDTSHSAGTERYLEYTLVPRLGGFEVPTLLLVGAKGTVAFKPLRHLHVHRAAELQAGLHAW